MPAIFISVPTHRSMIDASCAISIAGLLYHLGLNKIEVSLNNVDSADIAFSRNSSAAEMLSDPKFTHLLCIDSDMVFPAALVAELVKANRDIIGCVYPQRFGNGRAALSRVAQSARTEADDARAIGKAAGFVPRDLGKYTFENRIAEVHTVGMGLCLIQRSVFEKLIATGKVPPAKVLNDAPYGFFQQIVRDGVYYGEDESLCLRWRELCGGKVYALASKDIAHIARVEVRASPV